MYIYTYPVHSKQATSALKQHHKTFRPSRHDPEHWEYETTLLESLRGARERMSAAEKGAETNGGSFGYA